MSDLVGNPKDWFSRIAAQVSWFCSMLALVSSIYTFLLRSFRISLEPAPIFCVLMSGSLFPTEICPLCKDNMGFENYENMR